MFCIRLSLSRLSLTMFCLVWSSVLLQVRKSRIHIPQPTQMPLSFKAHILTHGDLIIDIPVSIYRVRLYHRSMIQGDVCERPVFISLRLLWSKLLASIAWVCFALQAHEFSFIRIPTHISHSGKTVLLHQLPVLLFELES